MKTNLLLILTLIGLSACSEKPIETKKNKTILDSKTQITKNTNKTTHIESISHAIPNPTPSGANLYAQKCASCHGKNAEKSALNSSASIAGWNSQKLQAALIGYKDGSYGKKMKNIMQGQTSPLSDIDIKLLSDYISIL